MHRSLEFHNSGIERIVREKLSIPTGPISMIDALRITELDITNYTFNEMDIDTLTCFTNIEKLDLETFVTDMTFLKAFPKLKNLGLCYTGVKDVDFRVFADCVDLEVLFVSGGVWSDVNFINIEALCSISKLKNLFFHEFGEVDLVFLQKMPWIEQFYCGWAKKVKNIDSIGKLYNLRSLSLLSLEMDNLDFLDSLPDGMDLNLMGDEVHEGIIMEKLDRFNIRSIDGVTVNGKSINT